MTNEQLSKGKELCDRMDNIKVMLCRYNRYETFDSSDYDEYFNDNLSFREKVDKMMKECLEKELADLKAEFEAL